MSVVAGRHRVVAVVGLIALVVGVVDPLEGSLLILPASCAVALVARLAGSRYERLLYIGLALVLFGFAAIWIMTAIGGVGGSTDRSAWWALLAVPILPGWLFVVAGGVLALREKVDEEQHATKPRVTVAGDVER